MTIANMGGGDAFKRRGRPVGGPQETPQERDRKAALRALHAVGKDVGLDHEGLRAFVGVESLTHCDAEQIQGAIHELREVQAGGQVFARRPIELGGFAEWLCDRVRECEALDALWIQFAPWAQWAGHMPPDEWGEVCRVKDERRRFLLRGTK